MNLITIYKNQTPLIRFIVNGIFLFLLWNFFYHFVRYNSFIDPIYEKATLKLSSIVLFLSQKILNSFGYETHVQNTIIYIEGARQSVNLLRGCLGRNLMGIFSGFILAFPGKWKNKTWFIPLGIFSIIFINILRIIGLAYNSYCCPESMKFNHDTFFNYSIYISTFVLWIIWIRYFSAIKTKKQKEK